MRAAQKVYPRLGLRDSDIILASFPKSGNTWMRFIWANMVSLKELGGREIDFRYLMTQMVANYDEFAFGEQTFDILPRLVKTHRRFQANAFEKNRSIYIIRHPGDVMSSYYEYVNSNKKTSTFSNISDFIRDEEFGVRAWCMHVKSWRKQANIVTSYEDMKRDASKATRQILNEFNLDSISDPVVEEAVRRSSFEKLREIEEDQGRPTEKNFEAGFKFMRKGKIGEWGKRLNLKDLKYIQQQVEEAEIGDLYSLKKEEIF